jgi:hypothetical protein
MNESNEQLKIISYLAQHLSFGPAANLYKNVQIIKSIYSLFMGDHFNTICVSLTSSHFFILIFTYFLSCTEKIKILEREYFRAKALSGMDPRVPD